jgi:glutamate dehydrogenase/leucine dehydrogenase
MMEATPLTIFEAMAQSDHEQVLYCSDPNVGLRAIIAIHSTRLGPALGGTRFYPYADEQAALTDVLRLSRGMTQKAAVAGLDLGGGKAVIIGDPASDRTEALLRAFGRHVDSLGGRYITAEDVGTSTDDMAVIRRETTHVVGLSEGLGGSGDPSPATARGVLHAMHATAQHLWDNPSLQGRRIVVSGIGKVGAALARLLVIERAEVVLANRSSGVAGSLATELGCESADYGESQRLDCDIWSPCALGGVLDAVTIAALRCKAVVGAANNQLADGSCAELLRAAGIVYAPDYVVNAGGLTNVALELSGYRRERAEHEIARVGQATTQVLDAAQAEGITTVEAAERLASDRIARLGAIGLRARWT